MTDPTDVIERAQAWLAEADKKGINRTDRYCYLAVIEDLVAEVEFQRTALQGYRNRQLELTEERDALRVDVEKYMELLYAIYRKWPGESRHETALRYIRERESCSCCGQGNAAREQQPGGRGE